MATSVLHAIVNEDPVFKLT